MALTIMVVKASAQITDCFAATESGRATGMCSQVVQVRRERVTGLDAQVVGVVCNLVRVHDRTRNLDGPHEVKVVVAQVVCELLDLALSHRRRVPDNEVVHRQGRRDSRLVGHHVEVEAARAGSVFGDRSVDDRAGRWVRIGVALLFDQSGVDLLVNKAVDELGVVIACHTLDRFVDRINFILNYFGLVARTADTVSVDRNG